MITDTKAHILETAMALFNSASAAVVSTNHIAMAASISPGNLYYHFRNKEEIIRALVERMLVEWATIWQEIRTSDRNLDRVQAAIGQNLLVSWRYRFFFRELIPILNRDAELKARFLTSRQSRIADFETLLNDYAAAGFLRKPDNPVDFRLLISACLLINNQWLIEAELEFGAMADEQVASGTALFMYLLRPYLIANP